MGFLDLKYDIFGLDINDLSLKIVKLKKKHNGFDLVSFNEEKIPQGIIEDGVIRNEEALVKILKYACNTVKGKKLKTKYIVASLPEEKSFLQVIKIPKMEEEELKLAVPLEAENYIPLPINEVYLDFQVINQNKNQSNYFEVLIVAMPKKIVDSYVSCFKKANLTPVVLEAESEAIIRALVKKEKNLSLLVLIDFGKNNTNFVIFSGNSVRFTTSIPISSQLLTKTISENLKIDLAKAEKLKLDYGINGRNNIRSWKNKKEVAQIIIPILEDLILQIKKYLNFYRDHSSFEHLSPIEKTGKILICGGGAKLKGLADFMSEKLDVKVEIANISENIFYKQNDKITNKDLIFFTTAIGLALRNTEK